MSRFISLLFKGTEQKFVYSNGNYFLKKKTRTSPRGAIKINENLLNFFFNNFFSLVLHTCAVWLIIF